MMFFNCGDMQHAKATNHADLEVGRHDNDENKPLLHNPEGL